MTLSEFKSVEEAIKYIACLRDNKNKGCKTEGEAFDAFVAHHDYLGANNLMFEIIQHLQDELKRKDELLRYEINFLNHLLIFGFSCEDNKKCLEQTKERIKELEQALAEQQPKEG